MQDFSEWLATTWISHLFSDHIWTIVISQTVHIVGVAIIMIAIAIINLRILGLAGRSRSVAATVAQFTPWIWATLIVLLLTGILQTLAEPGREIMNVVFRVKVVLLLAVCWITYYYAKVLRTDAHYLDLNGANGARARTLGYLSLFLWVGIVVCGRLIAYVGAIYA
jgi:hypothetical protein